jgi:hypothetical protein
MNKLILLNKSILRNKLNRQSNLFNGRLLHYTHNHLHSKQHSDGYKITFFTPEQEEIECWANDDETLLDVAHANNVELEGACEGSCG